jgi:hypothetical protein
MPQIMDAEKHVASKSLEEFLTNPLAHMKTNTTLYNGIFWVGNLCQDKESMSCANTSNPLNAT